MATSRYDVIVIGGGPAGMAAAVSAARGGARVAVLDDQPRLGGQFWRHGPAGVGVHHHDHNRWHRLSAAFADAVLTGMVVHRAGHRVWRLDGGVPSGGAPGDGGQPAVVHAVEEVDGDERPVTLSASAVVVATGAHDRVLPFPGWDLPGVLTAGAAQALLKEHGVVAGRRVVVAGTGPFLLPLAAGLASAGAQVIGVLEAGDGRGWAKGWRAVLGAPAALGEGAAYLATLVRHRVPVLPRSAVVAAHGSPRDGSAGNGSNGDVRVESVTVARLSAGGEVVPGSARRLACDAVAVGWGFVPRLDLALQAGAVAGVSELVGPDAGAAVRCDLYGATDAPGIFVAGEVGGVGGAKLAVVTGVLAGAAAAAVSQGRRPAAREVLLERRRTLGAFAAAMHAAHPVPQGWAAWLDDDTVVCRCEEVTAGRLREAVDELGVSDLRTAKLLTRCGMGWCQGRICGEAVSRLVGPGFASATLGPTGPASPDSADVASRPVAVPIRLSSLLDLPEPTSPDPGSTPTGTG